ncbi:MAG: 3,4-dihydroxy 2-butanone 4-phosphate synthase/GTP cyclohydrolase II [Motiliproteus sp.]|jgi:3,4-dihydroxy 2-butanone 4-phosphate synthase/GTP cyclohydrolase II
MELNSTAELIEDIRQGKMVILMDDEDRENEGDLVIAAEKVSAQDINFMATHARGLICLTLTREHCTKLNLPLMVQDNGAQYSTNFTLSIEAAEGVTTGISAADRAHTVRTAVDPKVQPVHIVQPGHIFPLMAQPGGVLSRAGHTEAGCDLGRLAGCTPAAAIVEIMNEDGTMARRPDLELFAEKHDLKIGTIADLIHYRIRYEHTVERDASYSLHTDQGEFQAISYRDSTHGSSHIALVKGEIKADQPTLVRVHTADVLRDVVGVSTDEPKWTLRKSLQRVAEEGCGVVVLLGDSGPEDLVSSLEAHLNHRPVRPANVDGAGTYMTIGTGSQILRDLGVSKMRLLSSPIKFNALSGFELEVIEFIPCES